MSGVGKWVDWHVVRGPQLLVKTAGFVPGFDTGSARTSGVASLNDLSVHDRLVV